jgi:hypothetical protein
MPDKDKKPDTSLHGKAQKKSTSGGRDSHTAKVNKNITQALPDRVKQDSLEAAAAKEMSEVQATVFQPWQRNVIKLQSQGWSFERIIERGIARRRETGRPSPKRVMYPSRKLLYAFLGSQPEFRESCDKAFEFAVDAEAQRTLELAKSLDQIEGLKPPELVNARDKRIQRTLQVAGRIMPDKWGEQAEGDREVIVFEASGGWVPVKTVQGVPGQGDEGGAAREKWRKMREEAKDA